MRTRLTPAPGAVGSSQLTQFVIEDCQVCCQPIELVGEVDEDGSLREFTVGRG
jgi:hypothetical protein